MTARLAIGRDLGRAVLHARLVEPAPTDEEKELDPTSIYALNKADQERMVLQVGAAYGIPSVALRFFNIFGPRQALSNPYTGVAAIFSSTPGAARADARSRTLMQIGLIHSVFDASSGFGR